MKGKKQALLTSGLCLGLSAALLAGATFAWFTDSVTNKDNTIQAGTLDIELNEDNTNAMFTTQDGTFLWEPGRSQKATATITNTGSLWLKYTMSFANVEITGGDNDSDADITEVLDVYLVDGKSASAGDLIEDNYLGTMADLMARGYFGDGNNNNVKDRELAPDDGTDGTGDDEDTFTVVIKMQEGATNMYQGCTVNFDILVNAAQAAKEQDGFGSSDYDINSEYILTDSEDILGALNGDEVYVDFATDVTGGAKITGDKVINGHGASMKAPTGQALWIEGTEADVTVENVVFEGGGSNAVVRVYEAETVTFKDCVFENGQLWTAFEEVGQSKLVFENCKFIGCGISPVNVNGAGWADVDTQCDVTFRNCEIQGSVQHLIHLNDRVYGNVTLEGCTLNNKDYTPTGGVVSALWIQGGADDGKVNVTVTNTSYTGPNYQHTMLVKGATDRVKLTLSGTNNFNPSDMAMQG